MGNIIKPGGALLGDRVTESLGNWTMNLPERTDSVVTRINQKLGELQTELTAAQSEVACLKEKLAALDGTYANYVREKTVIIRNKLYAYRDELFQQMQTAWMRADYATADRIANLIGHSPRPSDHEKAGA